MPRVPASEGPIVRDAALAPSYQSAPDVAQTSRAAAVGLGAAATAANDIAYRDAQTAASQADAEIAQAYLQWDVQARRQYRGKDADGYVPAAQAWWAKTAETYGQQLDPRAKALVSQSLLQKQTQALGSAQVFAAAEKERHADDMAAADIDSAIQFGVTTGGVAGAAQQVRGLVAGIGARKGWETAQVEEATVKQLSGLHLAYISSLAQNGPAAASAYFQANKAEIGAPQQARVEQVLKGETDNQAATQKAAEWAPLPYADQLAKAADINDPALREKTLLQVKNNHGQIKEAQQERERQYSDQAWQLVGQGRRVPEAVLGAMDGRERVQLQDYLRQRAEHAAAQGAAAVKTDPAEHARLIDMMLNDPEAFKRERIAASAMKLSPSDLKQFAEKQQAMRGGGDKQDTMLTDDQRISGAMAAAGVDAKSDPTTAYQVRSEIDRRVRAESAAKGGKNLTGDEKQAVVDSVLMDKALVPGWLWGGDEKPVALMTPDELGKAYVTVNGKDVKLSTVPPSDRQAIIAGRRARGLPVTEQAIVETYLKAKGK